MDDFRSVTALSGLMTLTFELNVSRGTDNLPANFGVSVTFHCPVMVRSNMYQADDMIFIRPNAEVNLGFQVAGLKGSDSEVSLSMKLPPYYARPYE